MSKSTDFLKAVFGPVTTSPVWIQSLGNDRDGGEAPKHVATRDMTQIDGFIAKWDRPGRGLFFSVATINDNKRRKEHAAEGIGPSIDIDFKDVDDTAIAIDRKLLAARLPPSIVNDSGNGRHAYWLLKEAADLSDPDTMERYEAVTKLLCDIFGGDQVVTQCVALMRLPGTHNTKRDAWREVSTVHDSGVRYELDDLEEWVAEQSILILRKVRPDIVTADTNPFLAYAKAAGFKPSIDVEKRLAGMSYMAGGDAAIHGTQLAVSASLLKAGMITGDVVQLILDATRGAATGYGERWNWKREERAIEKMCSDWLKKHPVEQPAPRGRMTMGDAGECSDPREYVASATVTALAPKRAAKAVGTGIPLHIILGSAVLGAMGDRGEAMLVTDGEVWRYRDGIWAAPLNEGSWLNGEIEIGARALELPSNIKLINETRQWLLRHPDVIKMDVRWDHHGMIPTRSGLLDVKTLTLEPAKPSHLATWRIECEYNSSAECPWWVVMLNDFFGDRPDELRDATIATLQEVLGAALMEVKPRALTRALVLEGPSEAGKTRILDVMGGLICDRPIATPLDVLGGTHGLMEFRRRAPWVLHEAFNAGQWHMSSVVKSILTGDPVQINVKNGAITTQRIKSPVFWGTNHPPQFKEATKAIVNRMIVLKCRVVFDPKNLIGAAAEAHRRGFAEPSDMILATEMPGLLNWAVIGYQRASRRGHIATTAEMVATMEAVRQDSNIVAGFIEECIDFGAGCMVSTQDFCAAFTVWWLAEKGEDRRMPSNDTVGRAMSALGDNRIGIDPQDFRDKQRRYYGGINLNGIGLDYWEAAHSEGLAKGKTARTSSSRNDVNRVIPDAWAERNAVARLAKNRVTLGFPASVTSGESSPVKGDTTPRF